MGGVGGGVDDGRSGACGLTSGQKGRTHSWKREKADGTSQVILHFSMEPKMLDEGAVRKLASAMPITIPTCEQTPTEPRMPIGEISVM